MSARDFLLSACMAIGLAGTALAQQPIAPAPAAKPDTKAKAEVLSAEEDLKRCERDLRGVGSVIGKKVCTTTEERRGQPTPDAGREAQQDDAQEFLRQSLTVPSIGGAGVAGF